MPHEPGAPKAPQFGNGLPVAALSPRAPVKDGRIARSLLTRPVSPPSIILIGASTGGPQALSALLARLATRPPAVPVIVAVHMPRDFTKQLAAQISRVSKMEARIVQQKTRVRGQTIFVAPGDMMLVFERERDGFDVLPKAMTAQDQCRTSVDGLFQSAASVFGRGALAIVLSGMGVDGLAGARAITAAGGTVLVQDAQTSAVWGMPGAIAKAGLAAAVLPPEALAFEVARRLAEQGSVQL